MYADNRFYSHEYMRIKTIYLFSIVFILFVWCDKWAGPLNCTHKEVELGELDDGVDIRGGGVDGGALVVGGLLPPHPQAQRPALLGGRDAVLQRVASSPLTVAPRGGQGAQPPRTATTGRSGVSGRSVVVNVDQNDAHHRQERD